MESSFTLHVIDNDAAYDSQKKVFKFQLGNLRDASVYFKGQIEQGFTTSTIKSTATAITIWHGIVHNVNAVAVDYAKIKIDDLYHAIEFSKAYSCAIEKLGIWFEGYWAWLLITHTSIDIKVIAGLVYPCYALDFAEGFMYVTKALAYRSQGYIMENNPTTLRHLHMDSRITQQINAAKGNLKTILHRGIFNPIQACLHQTCHCKERALFQYCVGLDKTGVWPLESVGKKSMAQIIISLQKFEYRVPENACLACQFDFREEIVARARMSVLETFGGLCLDCLDKSKVKTGSISGDYWEHVRYKYWDKNCRVKHDQTTWYFSFMGRREDREAFNKEKRKD